MTKRTETMSRVRIATVAASICWLAIISAAFAALFWLLGHPVLGAALGASVWGLHEARRSPRQG